MARVLVIPDLHCPYHHPLAFQFLRKVWVAFRCDTAVCLGDELDAHAWSLHGKATRAKGSQDEFLAARMALKSIFLPFGGVKVCHSNHVVRAASRAEEAGVPPQWIRTPAEALELPSCEWRDSWCIDGVNYFHGDGYSGAQGCVNAALDQRGPVVMGHLHGNAGVYYTAGRGGVLWGMSAGCLIDPTAAVFAYAKHTRRKPLLGCGVVINGVPTWLPINTKLRQR